MPKIITAGLLSLLFIFCNSVSAQVQTAKYVSMIPHSNAFYEYLPQGYPEPNKKYPVLIFFHGLSEVGPGNASTLPYLLNIGPAKEINNGTFPTSFTVNNQNFKFIVISPQFTEWPTEQDADDVITYLLNNYPVDINRVYLTGLSMGGGVVWNYCGSSSARAARAAAIVPVCGAAWPDYWKAVTIAGANLPVWATHNSDDNICPVSYTNQFVSYINSAPAPPNPLAKKTIFQVSTPTHDAWSTTYSPSYKENGMNIYEWMLQYQRTLTVLPVTGLSVDVTAQANHKVLVNWKTLSELNTKSFTLQKSLDGLHFTAATTISSKSINGGGASYSFTDNFPINGINYYRVLATDADGRLALSTTEQITISNSNATISVFPNPATEILNIASANGFARRTLQIRNISGQLVHTEVLNNPGVASINITSLNKGIYYGTVLQDGGSQHFKFIKN